MTTAVRFGATAAAAEDRRFCPERPGLLTPACTIAPGKVAVETGLGDWTLEQDADSRTDTILLGDTTVRIGVSDAVEAQVGWTPFGHVRERDKTSGDIDSRDRVGDVTLGFKANLQHPNGKGLSIALNPFVTLPVGRMPVGGGTWGAGLLAPVTYDLSKKVNLQFTSEIDAAVDEDGHGRHFAASETAGFSVALSKVVKATIETQVLRDDDPDGATTQALGALSFAWMVSKKMQLDIGGAAGLNRDAPDGELYFGIARLF
jgi:hypothetical protein